MAMSSVCFLTTISLVIVSEACEPVTQKGLDLLPSGVGAYEIDKGIHLAGPGHSERSK
jgi:hypothetical protein